MKGIPLAHAIGVALALLCLQCVPLATAEDLTPRTLPAGFEWDPLLQPRLYLSLAQLVDNFQGSTAWLGKLAFSYGGLVEGSCPLLPALTYRVRCRCNILGLHNIARLCGTPPICTCLHATHCLQELQRLG